MDLIKSAYNEIDKHGGKNIEASASDSNALVMCEPTPIGCAVCDFESHDMSSFILLPDDSLICLDCGGLAPPTCGEHGDW